MSAYFGPWRLVCPQPVTPAVMALARKLVGGMLDVGGIPTRTWKLDDGTVITALIVNGLPNVHVSLPPPVTELPVPFTSLWIPRGFVVYPAWADAPMGVGLPIVQQGSDPYASTNLSPGLTTTRWTAGGPCGEVLLSPDDQAGYPLETVFPTPLLADATAGPQFRWTGPVNVDARIPSSTWAGYRLELAPFSAHFSGENIATQQALFEAVNNVRHTAGQTQALLRFRGFARVAEMAASIFDAAGKDDETSTTYPVTFQSSADRLTKEGYAIDWTDANLSSFTRADMFAMYEFRASGLTPTAAVQAWQQQSGSMLTANLGSSVQADVGYRNGFSVLALTARDRWLEAGNANWQSPDTTLPPISWHSFASVNLAWETFPAAYDASTPSMPLDPLFPFTGSTGDCWLFYPRSTTVEPCYYDGAMGRHIYSRGRSIALAPEGGLVWAAGVIANGRKDRLVALVHHSADQPSDTRVEGCTRYLRVWWADIPRRDSGQRLAPQLTICGTGASDDWSWRGGTLIDLGSMPAPTGGSVASTATANSLKYASCWRFSPDGTHAVCLRDYGAAADYTGIVENADWTVGSRMARAVELVFAIDADNLSVSTVFHDYTAGLKAPPRPLGSSNVPDCPDRVSAGNTLLEYGALPLAVDYNAAGKLVYAYQASIGPDVVPVYAHNSFRGYSLDYVYTGTGDASVQYASDLGSRVLIGATVATPGVQQAPGVIAVLDVNAAAFVAPVAVSAYATDPASWPNPNGGQATFDKNPNYLCPTFTAAAVAGVQLSQGGAVVSIDWYANPDGELNTPFFPCVEAGAPTGAISYLPLAVSANLQGHFARRLEQTLYGYQKAPVPQAAVMLNTSPSGVDGCGCQYTVSEFANSALAGMTQQAPRGGKAAGSVPMPANDWLIYSKVV